MLHSSIRHERVAANGLRYNRFHTTALCSPSRAALITGRNHHTCATGVITEFGTGFPGYNSIMPKSCGTGAEILRQNGKLLKLDTEDTALTELSNRSRGTPRIANRLLRRVRDFAPAAWQAASHWPSTRRTPCPR